MTSPDSSTTVRGVEGLGKGPTRVALVGAGYIADYHALCLSKIEGVEIVAVCDQAEDKASDLAKRYGVEHVTTKLEDLPGLGVQVAHVLVPPHLHVDISRQLLELGLGVLVEKPAALCTEDARSLEALAAERDLPFGVNHNNAFHPQFESLLGDLRAGKIGRLEHVQVTLCVPLRQLDAGDFSHWMFQQPRNIIFEQAPHPFSQLVELIGRVKEMNVTVQGTRELFPGQPFHDRWVLAATGERGTAEVLLAFGQDFTRSTIQVLGTDGSIQCDLHHGHYESELKTQYLDFWNTYLAGRRRGKQLLKSAGAMTLGWFKQTLGLAERCDSFFVGMRNSLAEFHAAAAAGRAPRCDAANAVAVTEWCDRATENIAAASDRPLPSFEHGPPREGEVCLLGGTGFIGRRVLRKLLERGVPVTAVVRRAHALPPELVEASRDGRVRLVRASLSQTESLRAAVQGAKTVLHLATGGGNSWEEIQRIMVEGTKRLGQLCLEEKVERLLYVSSTAALYLGADCGTQELDDEIGPDPKSNERALYARGKADAERVLMELYRSDRLPVTIIRPAIVMGDGTPLQHSGLGLWVRDNHCVGWGLGKAPAPLVDVEDVAEALALATVHQGNELVGKGLNLSSRQTLGAREIVERLAQATGRAFVFHPRSLVVSQTMEIGKWLVKKAGRRRDAVFPSYRDLKSRSLAPTLTCRTARELLGWQPCDDGEELLRRALGSSSQAESPK
ncbi:MAG: putative dehydrogenase/nucleoside-diphosphate-sugar epimerase [Planctomycetota bacterium]|jgi:predicted dehydrogenase/nucleoside-diphosphate-sugar epimerase